MRCCFVVPTGAHLTEWIRCQLLRSEFSPPRGLIQLLLFGVRARQLIQSVASAGMLLTVAVTPICKTGQPNLRQGLLSFLCIFLVLFVNNE